MSGDAGSGADRLGRLLLRWRVVAERTLTTPSSRLVFGTRDGRPVVLKVTPHEEEQRGARLLRWWDGRGAVRVLELDGDAVLLERLTGSRDLVAMSGSGADDEATAILASTVARLHASGVPESDDVGLLPLRTWFRELVDREHEDPVLQRCAVLARVLLDGTRECDVVALHGDVHHGNVLDAGDEWLAIDPKGLVGHRAFDCANLLVNPDERAVDLLPRRLPIVAAVTGIDERVLRDWTVAWCGLSWCWLGDDEPAWHDRSLRRVAAALLGMPRGA